MGRLKLHIGVIVNVAHRRLGRGVPQRAHGRRRAWPHTRRHRLISEKAGEAKETLVRSI